MICSEHHWSLLLQTAALQLGKLLCRSGQIWPGQDHVDGVDPMCSYFDAVSMFSCKIAQLLYTTTIPQLLCEATMPQIHSFYVQLFNMAQLLCAANMAQTLYTLYSFYGTPTMWEMAGSKFCTPINANQTQSLPIWILGPWTVKLLLLSSFTKRLEAGCYCNEGYISILSLSFSLGELRRSDWKSGTFLDWLEGESGKLTTDQVRLRLCCTTPTLVSRFIPTKQLLWISLEVLFWISPRPCVRCNGHKVGWI